MNFQNRRDVLFLVLGGVFVANALLGEILGGSPSGSSPGA
jgi:hypothetical protein